jgi:hypothetical protein
MGTKQHEALVKEIKSLIGRLGWSQNKLAEVLYVAMIPDDESGANNEPDEIKKFHSKLKKQLTRSTTSSEILRQYIRIISHHSDFKKLDMVVPDYIESSVLPEGFQDKMKAISQKITEDLERAAEANSYDEYVYDEEEA